MPHLIVEFTANLGAGFDPDAALRAANASLIESGSFHVDHIKSRAIPLAHHRVGDAEAGEAFVHAELRLLPGRSAELRKALGEGLLQALKGVCQPAAGLRVQLTVEVLELQREFYSRAALQS